MRYRPEPTRLDPHVPPGGGFSAERVGDQWSVRLWAAPPGGTVHVLAPTFSLAVSRLILQLLAKKGPL